jgi:hypothetical protein
MKRSFLFITTTTGMHILKQLYPGCLHPLLKQFDQQADADTAGSLGYIGQGLGSPGCAGNVDMRPRDSAGEFF